MTRTITAGLRQSRVQRAFVAAQIAAATVLLVGMALMSQGLVRLERVTPGFRPDHALAVQLSLPPDVYADRRALVGFFEALRGQITAIAGVERVGAVSLLPLSGLLSAVDVAFPDRPAPPPDEVPQAHFRIATADYFSAAGISILEGRAFTDLDREDRRSVAIVSRTFATRHWRGEHAVGKFVQIVQSTASPSLEIVGVVSDVKQSGLDGPPTADLYVPLPQMPASQAPLLASRMYWVIRAHVESPHLARVMREAVNRVDAGVAASSVKTLQELWSASLQARRVTVRVLQFFGAIALGLCALGVYGVAAFAARTRRRELAIRAALGASGRDLTVWMLRRELAPVFSGLGVGLLGALIAAPALFASAFNTDLRNATTYSGVTAVLLAVAGVASYMPIRRAGKKSPAEALNAPY